MNIYYNKFINFLKNHNLYDEEIFNYFRNNSIYFNYLEEEKRDYIGVYNVYDKNKKLKKITPYIPFIDNDITALINVHEYIHVFSLYKYLNKKISKQ